jgi:hypothetical protein
MNRALASTIGLLISAQALPGVACSTLGPEPTDEELFRKATTVFLARVVRTEEKQHAWRASSKPMPIVEGDFQIVEVLKGQPPVDGKVRDFTFGPGNCSLGLLAGADYIFFIQPGQENFVLWPTGSRMIINREGTEVVRLLEKLRKLK